jgi:hypothetical protein
MKVQNDKIYPLSPQRKRNEGEEKKRNKNIMTPQDHTRIEAHGAFMPPVLVSDLCGSFMFFAI